MNIVGCGLDAPVCGADGSLNGTGESRVRVAEMRPGIRSRVGLAAVGIAALALAACGGGGGGGGSTTTGGGGTTTTTYTVGGTVTGLSGTGLVLEDNGGDDLAVSTAGAFTFATALASGASYNVTVKTQPSGQTCTVTNGTGTVSANVTTVAVSCTTTATGDTIGGTVSRLAGTGLVLQDNGGDNLTVSANGSFTFKTPVATGKPYAVTVSTQPSSPTQYCVVENGSGTTASANVTSVTVMCAQFAYVANYSDGTIDGYTINPTSGALAAVGGNPYPDGMGPAAVSLSPNGMFAFSASNDGTKIHAYTISQTNGELTEVAGSPFSTGFTVGSSFPDIAVDAQSAHLYLASAGDGKVAGFSISSSGALTALAGSPYAAGTGAGAIPAFSPDGNYLYVMNQTANTVSAYSIAASTGVLTPLAGTPPPTGASPDWIVFTPNGKYAYVANKGEDTISMYTVASGVLTPMATPTVASDEHPQDLTIDASGTHLYAPVANGSTAGAVQVYTIGATGLLTSLGSTPAGVGPIYLALDPAGPYAYVSSSQGAEVYGYSISSTTGMLTALANSPFSTGAGSEPQFITIDPSGRFGYTANEGTANITGFTISSTTGELTAMSAPFPAGTQPIFVSISPEVPGIRD